MTENTKSGHARGAGAPIPCERTEKRTRNHEVSSEIGWQGDCADNRKTLGL